MTSINLKIDTQSKIKRVRELPQTIEALRSVVESQLDPKPSQPKSYAIQYRDGQQDVINISDDEDLLTAYDVALKELQGNLKLNVTLKAPAESPSVSIGTEEEKKETKKPKEKKPKKTVKESTQKKTKKAAPTAKAPAESDDA